MAASFLLQSGVKCDIIKHMNEKGECDMAKERTYIAIDLKSFYASQECIERELDPMTTNLLVADSSRT